MEDVDTRKTMMKKVFPTPEALSEWLLKNGGMTQDELASWGVKAGTKNVHNLWIELSEGESFFDESKNTGGFILPPRRTVRCVVVRIMSPNNCNSILIESDQELSDGSFRHRGKPLGEKMKPGETVASAAIRAVREELGSAFPAATAVDDEMVKILASNDDIAVSEERDSGSYPGLPSRYIVHTVDAFVNGLPEGDFTTVENEFSDGGKAITVKKHFWKWAPTAAAP